MGFGFCGRDIADGLEQTSIIEPIDPFKSGELDGFHAFSGASGFFVAAALSIMLGRAMLTDGSMPALVRCSVYLIDTYSDPGRYDGSGLRSEQADGHAAPV